MSANRWTVRLIAIGILIGLTAYRLHLKNLPLAPQLVSANNTTRNMALPRIDRLSVTEKSATVEALLAFQNDPDPRVRRNMLYALRELGEAKPEVLNYCVKALGDPDKSVREESLLALARFGDAAVPSLIAVLGNSDGEILDGAVRVLARMGAKAVPGLIELLKNPSAKGRGPALLALRQIGQPAKDAAPVLKGLLASNDPELRLNSAEVLANLGKLPKSAAPSLVQDLISAKESYKDLQAPRPRLAQLLEKVDPRRRTLVDLGFDLKQKNPVIRYRAAYVISQMNPPNLGAMEMAVDALEDPDVMVAARAMVALTRMGLDKTERLRKIAEPRMRSAVRRAQAANIEGFNEIVGPALTEFLK